MTATDHDVRFVVPLPRSTHDLIRKFEEGANPGLLLDKYVPSWNEGKEGKLAEHVQRPRVELICYKATEPSKALFVSFREAWDAMVKGLAQPTDIHRFTLKTSGRLVLHLSRGTALENAGICLHPIYGFVYLPGSGLKGLAHAYATEVWLDGQTDKQAKQASFEKICHVFGYARSPWLTKLMERHKVSLPERPFGASGDNGKLQQSAAGTIVFHDAWPTEKPKLEMDIVNCHHPDYYAGKNEDAYPGDWEDPIPVNFPAVAASSTFEFVLTTRRARSVGTDAPPTPDEQDHLSLAEQWLVGGLTHMGFGGKTAAGYGRFEPSPEESSRLAVASGTPASERFELTLATPAFLAGAHQASASRDRDDKERVRSKADCRLRVPTLRGQLRWWWRTMHAGYLELEDLKKLENAVWGDTKRGSPVRLTVRTIGKPEAILADFKEEYTSASGNLSLRPAFKFAQKHDLQIERQTTPGYLFLSFGMDDERTERGPKDRFQRHYVEPGAKWSLAIDIVPAEKGDSEQDATILLTAEQIRLQVHAALWLLTNHGGVGAKSRNGFGCFAGGPVGSIKSLDDCDKAAAALRSALTLSNEFRFDKAGSPSLQRAETLDLQFSAKNPWQAIDRVGIAYRNFTQAGTSTGHGKHCEEKAALGLPRKIHRRPHQQDLESPKGKRYAKPFHIHLSPVGGGLWQLRVLGLAAPWLYPIQQTQGRPQRKFPRDQERSLAMLKLLLDHFDRS